MTNEIRTNEYFDTTNGRYVAHSVGEGSVDWSVRTKNENGIPCVVRAMGTWTAEEWNRRKKEAA